jgi:hypothetical protein
MSKTALVKRRCILAGVAISSVILVAACVVFVVSNLSDTYAASSPTVTGAIPSVAVENLLHHSDRLPSPNTQLAYRDGTLAWEVTSESDVQIIDFEIQRVRLDSTPSFPSNLLDDDPVCEADVEVVVTTADGQDVRLVVELWEYALLTPWSLETTGDGWKPKQVHWLED